MHRNTNRISRRGLLRRAAAAGIAAAAAPYVLTSTALGAEGRPPASDRIVLGAIGIGARGSSDLGWMLGENDVQFVAICDIRKSRREAVKREADRRYGNSDCAMYRDLREFLAARSDVDVVLIATGERWHAMASITAMKAGKDMYCEKPGSMTIAEGQGLVEAARRYGRIFQTGTQRRSEGNFVFAEQLARTGRLGKLHTLRAHIDPWDPILKHDWLPAQPSRPATRWTGTSGWARARGARTTGRMSAAGGEATTTSTPATSASGAATPSASARASCPTACTRRSSSIPATTTARDSWRYTPTA